MKDQDVTAVLERVIGRLENDVGSWDDVLRRAAEPRPEDSDDVLRPAGAEHLPHRWMFPRWRIVVNVCGVEKRHSVIGLDERYELEANGHPGDWHEVRAVIAGLPERQRLVLFLRHYADLDYHTIAEVAGIERGTVAATLHAAHRKVRTAMTEVHR